MRKTLFVAALALVGVLVWAGTASAATELTLCFKSGDGTVRAGVACKANETPFKVVSAADFTDLEARVAALEAKVSALETLLAGVTRPDAGTLRFTGMNLQVVNGDGTTGGSNNGLGNIIVGYNTDNGDTRTGSHNVVIGDEHTWTRSAGFVSGQDNALRGPVSFVGGGRLNTASGEDSFVAGGTTNTASGDQSFAGGGGTNTASGEWSFAAGGLFNTASGKASFVAGGLRNTASGGGSFVVGGQDLAAGPGTCGYVLTTVFGTC